MKQSEKLDVLLKELYKYKFDGKLHSVTTLLNSKGIDINHTEANYLSKKLDSEGLIKIAASKNDISAEITSDGVAYCENDSFTHKGQPVINNNYSFSLENSPGANIVNQSHNVQINTKIAEIDNTLSEILTRIRNDDTVEEEKKIDVDECIEEIRNSLESGKVPKFGIKNLLGLISDISSVSGLAITLSQYL